MQHGMNKTNKFSDLSVLYRQMPAEKGGGGLKSILWNLASALLLYVLYIIGTSLMNLLLFHFNITNI